MNEIMNEISPLERKLLVILKSGPKTRDQLVKQTGIPRTTIYDGLKKLMARERVTRYPLYIDDRKRGRPRVVFQLNEDG